MLYEKYLKTVKHEKDYFAECKVYDDETNKDYYVVTSLESLLFATFESSYIDYLKGKTNVEPKKVEGDNSVWFDFDKDKGETKFFEIYHKTNYAAYSYKKDLYINRKYSRMKRKGNINYEIVSRRTKDCFSCGPCGFQYEIDFYIIDENKHLYVNSDDMFGAIAVTDYSFFDTQEKEQNGEHVNYVDPLEDVESFEVAKDSEYYDLYIEMEKFKEEV